jgi:hypothetical protein
MKNKIASLALVAILAGCATAPFVIGTALQIGACELAKARPTAQAPLLAAGLTFQSYASTEAPTGDQLAAAFANLPPLAGVDAVEVKAFVDLVLAGYGPLYASATNETTKANLRLWFGQVGNAFIAGSHCQPVVHPAGAMSEPITKPAPTWIDLGKEVQYSMKKVKKK